MSSDLEALDFILLLSVGRIFQAALGAKTGSNPTDRCEYDSKPDLRGVFELASRGTQEILKKILKHLVLYISIRYNTM